MNLLKTVISKQLSARSHYTIRAYTKSLSLLCELIHEHGQDRCVSEGSVRVLLPSDSQLFYNEVQTANRDLSIEVIKLFSEVIQSERTSTGKKGWVSTDQQYGVIGVTVLDALAASGLRCMRYIKEIPAVRQVTCTDYSRIACDYMLRGMESNDIHPDRMTVQCEDAIFFMHKRIHERRSYDVIDIDPFGSAVPFLDAAVQAVSEDGGLLCITCTDTAVLSGKHPETSLPRYGSMSFRNCSYKDELALRMLLHAVDSAANRHSRYVVPLLSVCIDFYVRVFVRVYTSPAEVKNTMLRRLMVYQSTRCPTFHVQSMGRISDRSVGNGSVKHHSAILSIPESADGGRWKIAGPLWGGPLHDQAFVDRLSERMECIWRQQPEGGNRTGASSTSISPPPQPLLVTAARLAGLLATIAEELKDVPFYHRLDKYAARLGCTTPPQSTIQSALEHLGYRVSRFHSDPAVLKTDAPCAVIWDVLRTYYRENHRELFLPSAKLTPPAKEMLYMPIQTPGIRLSEHAHGSTVRRTGPSRYPHVAAFWGPGRRPRGEAKTLRPKPHSTPSEMAGSAEDNSMPDGINS